MKRRKTKWSQTQLNDIHVLSAKKQRAIFKRHDLPEAMVVNNNRPQSRLVHICIDRLFFFFSYSFMNKKMWKSKNCLTTCRGAMSGNRQSGEKRHRKLTEFRACSLHVYGRANLTVFIWTGMKTIYQHGVGNWRAFRFNLFLLQQIACVYAACRKLPGLNVTRRIW